MLQGGQTLREAGRRLARRRQVLRVHPDAIAVRDEALERFDEYLGSVVDVVDAASRVAARAGVRTVRRQQPAPVPHQVLEPVVADTDAEVLRGDVFEQVRFVDHRAGAPRDDLAVGALAHRRVGAQQMVVHDDQVGFERPPAHARDEAVVVARAVAPDAVLRRRGDVVPERIVVRQVFHLRAVTRFGPVRPLPQRVDERAVGPAARLVALQHVLEPLEAEVVAATLHAGCRERHAQRVAQRRQVLVVDLILEDAGAHGHQHAASAEDGRHQVGQRLAGAAARLREQHAAALEDVADRLRHRALAGAQLERGQRGGQRAAVGERRGYAHAERLACGLAHSGSGRPRRAGG